MGEERWLELRRSPDSNLQINAQFNTRVHSNVKIQIYFCKKDIFLNNYKCINVVSIMTSNL